MKKKYLIGALFIFAIFYLIHGAFFANGEEKSKTGGSVKNVKTMIVAESDFHPTQDFSGFVSGAKQADISPKAGGYVTKLLKEEGDTIRVGEVLAVLDGSELAAMNESALMSLYAIQKTVKGTKDFYAQKVDEAEAVLKKTKESYSNGDVTKKDVKIAQEGVDSAKKMRDLQNYGAAANEAVAQGGGLVTRIAAKNATVTAPFSGVITRKYSSVGSFAAPGTPLYAIASSAELEVSVSIPGSLAGNISKDNLVSVYPEGQKNLSVSGYVFSVAQSVGMATQKSIVRIRFSAAEKSRALSLGQYARVAVPEGNPHSAILIPEQAILREYDDTFVFSLNADGTVGKNKITLGESFGELREVLSGITAGEKIVSEGQYSLRDGDVVVEK
jgi:RND family efflux transporter MFP subunit